MTGRQRGLKWKVRAGYRAPSWKHTSCCDYFLSSSVVSCAFSALCVYSTFRHHPHPLGYFCAKFCFFCSLHCCARPWRKITYSITHPAFANPIFQLIWCPGNRSFCFGIAITTSQHTAAALITKPRGWNMQLTSAASVDWTALMLPTTVSGHILSLSTPWNISSEQRNKHQQIDLTCVQQGT